MGMLNPSLVIPILRVSYLTGAAQALPVELHTRLKLEKSSWWNNNNCTIVFTTVLVSFLSCSNKFHRNKDILGLEILPTVFGTALQCLHNGGLLSVIILLLVQLSVDLHSENENLGLGEMALMCQHLFFPQRPLQL